MPGLIEDDGPRPGANAPEYSVSEISGAVKRVIEGEFGRIRVRGELGRVSRPGSGHVYLDLKDAQAVLAAVIWKASVPRLGVKPEEGLEVVATGRLTTFPGQSRYQMVIEALELAGAGALMAMLERRKAQLAAEGLFDAARKRPLPFLPAVIGVVTSPSGAVIRDILHRLRDRFPAHVLIWPVAVQGAGCAAEVAAAIAGFNALPQGGPIPRPDVLIIARGGGSVEDLMGFNEEIVVRAAAASRIPLISAVGHETDTTLIDFAADRRAPTPTAAAEMAVPVRLDLLAALDGLAARLSHASAQAIARRRQRLRDLARALPRPEALVAAAAQRLDAAAERLPRALLAATARRRARFAAAAALLRPQMLARSLAERRRRLAGLAARLPPERVLRAADRRAALAAAARRADRALAAALAALRARLAALDRLRQSLGYVETLRRGYAVVRGDGAVVTTRAAAERAASLEIEFQDGRLAPGAARPRGRGRTGDDGQGRLL